MKKSGRYKTEHLIENQFEPGSRGRVLRNLLGITGVREMNRLEKEGQIRAMDLLIDLFDANHRFSASDICKIHKTWLGEIYIWAGKYRQVKISKDDFSFAFPEQIPQLMSVLEKGPLRKFTPCRFESMNHIVKALSIVHTELLLIHPFRDGNGRVARMLVTLMALQAGLPPLNFKTMSGSRKKVYIKAVQAGISENYILMEDIFSSVIRKTLKGHDEK